MHNLVRRQAGDQRKAERAIVVARRLDPYLALHRPSHG
jgi:hypothetical protein